VRERLYLGRVAPVRLLLGRGEFCWPILDARRGSVVETRHLAAKRNGLEALIPAQRATRLGGDFRGLGHGRELAPRLDLCHDVACPTEVLGVRCSIRDAVVAYYTAAEVLALSARDARRGSSARRHDQPSPEVMLTPGQPMVVTFGWAQTGLWTWVTTHARDDCSKLDEATALGRLLTRAEA